MYVFASYTYVYGRRYLLNSFPVLVRTYVRTMVFVRSRCFFFWVIPSASIRSIFPPPSQHETTTVTNPHFTYPARYENSSCASLGLLLKRARCRTPSAVPFSYSSPSSSSDCSARCCCCCCSLVHAHALLPFHSSSPSLLLSL